MERRHIMAAALCIRWDGIVTVIHPHWAIGTIPAYSGGSSLSTWVLLLSHNAELQVVPGMWEGSLVVLLRVCSLSPRNPVKDGICLSFPLCEMGNSNSYLSDWIGESDNTNYQKCFQNHKAEHRYFSDNYLWEVLPRCQHCPELALSPVSLKSIEKIQVQDTEKENGNQFSNVAFG